jgi:hypothetical protein
LTSQLLDFDENELGGFQRGEAYQHVHDTKVNIVLSGSFPVAFHEISVPRRSTLKRPLLEDYS